MNLNGAGRDSYWVLRAITDSTEEDELVECARALVDGQRRGWEWRREGMWVYLTPSGVQIPSQGWKLHISATSWSAESTLAAVMPILLREAVAFKFAATREHVRQLNGPDSPRESAGKFITIYPRDDAQAVRLAQACDRVTAEFAAPTILSDRATHPGSAVHYRYGAFREDRILDEDGVFVDTIRDPNGNAVPDQRRAWFSPPPWVTDPFAPQASPLAGEVQESSSTRPSRAVFLNGRYVVQLALKHANKGGVFRAEDRTTGDIVVIKEARPHVEAHSREVSSALRHEARVLDAIADLGRSPRLIELFEQQKHLFLVEEHLPGSTLREYVSGRFAAGRGFNPVEVAALIRELAEIMEAFHRAGVLLRDLTPNNLFVLSDEPQLRLVDFELAHLLSDGPPEPWSAGTPGYAPPEQLAGHPTGLPDDYFAFGASVAFIATGMDPYLVPDRGPTRPFDTRLREWLATMERDGVIDSATCDIVRGCTAKEPAQRWGPSQVLDRLERPQSLHIHPDEPAPPTLDDLTRAAADVGRWLARNIQKDAEYLWPTSCFGLTADPCNVQSGVSGVGLFLCEAGRLAADPALRHLLIVAARWVGDHLGGGLRRPPGLYFGLSGVAWFLTEAASFLDDPALATGAGKLALSLPTSSFNPDVTHGTAGIGLGQLHQWTHSGDGRFLERAGEAAGSLVRAARPAPEGVVWPVPEGVRSAFAGLTSYGFAHGNAGIASFLLCAASALGEARYRDLAMDGLETLLHVAHLEGDAAFWEAGPDRPGLWPHWCNGSSGVGTALLRAHAVIGDERYREMAELAAQAVLATKWQSGAVLCHGLAGNGQFLLDLYEFSGEQRFYDQARELAQAMWVGRIHDDGLVVFPDESGSEVTAGFGTGLAGVGSFLLRLAHGSARSLMLDALLRRPVQIGGS